MSCRGSALKGPPAGGARRAFSDVGTLLYTSGTSGRPKGVMLSEENIFWGCTNFNLGNAVDRDSLFLCDMPLFHTAAACRCARAHPGRCYGAYHARVRPGDDAARLSDPALGVTHYFSVPQMAGSLWNHPDFDAGKLQGIVAWAIGGAPNPRAQTERFVRAGIRIAEGFGMSETGSNFGMPTDDLGLLLAEGGQLRVAVHDRRAAHRR